MTNRKSEIVYKILKPFIASYYKLRFRPTVIGKENIPEEGPIILCGNHINFYDQFNPLIVTKRAVHYMAKDEYFKGKRAWFYKSVGCIPVDRSVKDENAKSLAREVLENGGALGIFPEGTRNEITCKESEMEKLTTILDMSLDEIKEMYKNKCVRLTYINLLIDLNSRHLIDKDELKKYLLNPDNSLIELMNKKIITEEEYIDATLLPLKFGAVSLAKKTNALIIPFGISGLYTGKKGKLTTRIGKPINVKDMELEDANILLRKEMIKLIKNK